jgi:hypothetical protein
MSMTTAQTASLVLAHLAEHELPEPFSLHLTTDHEAAQARVQVAGHGLALTAGALLAWAHTLSTVSLLAWRPPTGSSIHLDLSATLTGPAGSVELTVYGGVPFGPLSFLSLEPGQKRPVSLGQLTTWAAQPGAGVAA